MTSIPPMRRSVSSLARILLVAGVLFVFLVGARSLGEGSKLLSGLYSASSNPFFALLIGLLTTSLVQSSSITTSMVVGLVAAPQDPLPIAAAIPMIMGANVGKTVPSTIASLARMGRKSEFRRSFSVAACDDFFNLMTLFVLLPIELSTGVLQKCASRLAAGLAHGNALSGLTAPGVAAIREATAAVFPLGGVMRDAAILIFSAALIITSLLCLVGALHAPMQRRAERLIERTASRGGLLAIVAGMIATIIVQSSSITTSLLVPLAGAGLLTLQQAFPLTVGANVGATVIVLLAGLAVAGPGAAAGLAVALIHVFFNVAGALILYPFAPLRRLPLMAAEGFADLAIRSRAQALGFVLLLFYAAPAAAALLYELAR